MRTGRGFTLVEMLAVVAVILLLLSIIMPSISGLTDTGLKLRCLGNLHQMHIAAYTYARDNKGLLVVMRPRMNGRWISFSDKLMPYTYGDNRFIDRDHNNRMDAEVYERRQLFRCPAAIKVQLGGSAARAETQLDYGINHYGRGGIKGKDDTKYYGSSLGGAVGSYWPHPRLSMVANPTVVYFADADTEQSPEDIGGISRGRMEWPLRHSFQTRAYKRHGGGYCCVALSGSAWWDNGLVPQNEKWFIKR